MFGGLFVVSIISSCTQAIKKSIEPTIPAENWANKELYYQDVINGVSVKQRMKNVECGKYRLSNFNSESQKKYPEPHRGEDGKIVIENCLLYNSDLKKYGTIKTMEWVKQGKYNLDEEGLKKERERVKKEYEILYSI